MKGKNFYFLCQKVSCSKTTWWQQRVHFKKLNPLKVYRDPCYQTFFLCFSVPQANSDLIDLLCLSLKEFQVWNFPGTAPYFFSFICYFCTLDILKYSRSVPTHTEVFPTVLLQVETVSPKGNPFSPWGACISKYCFDV